jgi:uncharacterized membrane protein YkoI
MGQAKKETPAQTRARKAAMLRKIEARRDAAPQQGRKRLTPSEAQKVALRKFPGRVASTKLTYERTGKWEYWVVVVSGKIVRDVYVDTITGVIWDARARKPDHAAKAAARKGKKPWEK